MPRFNRSPNPSAINDVTGWLGAGTRSRITGLSGIPRTTGGRVPAPSSSFSASLSCAPAVASAGQVWTAVGYFRTSVARTVRFYMACWNSGTFVTTTSANDQAADANTWYGFRLTGLTLPSGTYNQVSFHLDLPTSAGSSGNLDLSSCRLEQINDGTLLYADGDSGGGWEWDGTSGSSTSTLPDVQTITVSGIASGAAFGTPTVAPGPITISPTGVVSAEAFGLALVEVGVIRPPGIASGEAFGVPTILTGPVTISPVGIASGAALGTPELTITIDPALRKARRRPLVTYELVCVARVPQITGPPLLLEVDAIPWTGLSYTDELSKMQRLDAGAQVSRLSEPVLQRLRSPRSLPSELRLLRNGRPVFAGPLWGAQAQGAGESLSLQAVGLLGYLRFMFVTSTLTFTQADQHSIAVALIDHWQDSGYGNFGIDTSGVTPSGVLRDATYIRDEGHLIAQRVEELGLRENGFDVHVDPSSRALQLVYPSRGIDRSSGENAVVFDARNVTSGNVVIAMAPGDVASDAFGVGTGSGGDRIWSPLFTPDVRATFGRTGVFETFDGVSEQTTLDGHTQGMLDARGEALLIPGPDLRVTPDADLSSYDVGDTVAYQLHSRLGLTGAFRLRKRVVTVSAQTGQESVSVEFV